MSELSEYRERVAEVLQSADDSADMRYCRHVADILLAPGGVVAEIVAASLAAHAEDIDDRALMQAKERGRAIGAAEVRARVEALRSALERTEANLLTSINCKPVRDLTENLAENRAALADEQGSA
jgi:hypothetical protein